MTEVVFGRKNESIFNSFCSLLSILRYFYISMLTVGEGGPPPLCFMFFMAIGMCTISPIHWRDCGSCDLTLLSSIGCKNVSGFPAQYGNQLRRWVSRWGLSKKKGFFGFNLQQLYVLSPSSKLFVV